VEVALVQRPVYLLVPSSSVSNVILKRIPKDIWLLYNAFWYLAKGITNSVGLALQVHKGLLGTYKGDEITMYIHYPPRVVKYGKWAIVGSSMGCCSKHSYVHAVAWEYRR
jgi:hypothetical protein